MIPKEVLKQIRHIQIYTGQLVNDIFAGQYESVFKGRGMEFSEVREYYPGDDIRSIDWNVTARFNHPYIKKFVEERELTIILLIDLSASGEFGTQDKLKSQIITEIAAIIAFSAIKNNDKVGMIIFTDIVEKFIPPKKTTTHILRLIREMLYFKPEHKMTNLSSALIYLNEMIKRKSIVFMISDFIPLTSEDKKMLKITNSKHDLITITISDPRETEFPPLGIIQLEDAETGKTVLIDTNDQMFQKNFITLNQKLIKDREEFFSKAGIDNIKIFTNVPYIKPLIEFFQLRARRFR